MYAGELCLAIGPYGKDEILDISRDLGESISEAIISVIKDLLTVHLLHADWLQYCLHFQAVAQKMALVSQSITQCKISPSMQGPT